MSPPPYTKIRYNKCHIFYYQYLISKGICGTSSNPITPMNSLLLIPELDTIGSPRYPPAPDSLHIDKSSFSTDSTYQGSEGYNNERRGLVDILIQQLSKTTKIIISFWQLNELQVRLIRENKYE
ncbi:8069_t:CDS:2 [Scutellospora calospora]|uniref:8069_t:CDS:1 n=1 Tax=Scutellospora calospora TaxID=85575 RepID=A0ACA9JUM4_9GLOM|nr:8069_t:CDS:2 [Scutellospora calospora]